MIRTLIFLTFFIFTNNFIFGQNSISAKPISQINTIEETLYVHCNTTTLLTGETLLFKVYSLNSVQKTFSTISKIGYIELLNDANKSVLKQKIILKKGIGQGDFFISTTLKTGNYRLIAYTNWSLNKAENGISKTDLYLINPFENNTLKEDLKKKTSEEKLYIPSSVSEKRDTEQSSKSFIEAKTDKKKYNTREKVSLKLLSHLKNNTTGHFSVSVRKTDSLPRPKKISSVDFSNTLLSTANANLEKSRFLPELRGEIISGKVIAKDKTKDLKGKIVALSISDKSFSFKIAKTNNEGEFNFILEENPNNAEAVIQVMEKDRNDYEIIINQTNTPEIKPIDVPQLLYLNPKNKKEIENRSVANQIENNYFHKKRDSLTNPSKVSPFFHPLEKEYILDDYTRFPTLKETITEVLYEMSFRKEQENYSILIRDFLAREEAFEEALVMVDGLLIMNVNELFEYDMQNIYKVSFVNQGYVYGPKVFNGVINFVTKNNDYKTKNNGNFIKNVSIIRPEIEKKYFNPEYSNPDSERIPDFRYQLFWQPETTLLESEALMSFYTSDVKGFFEISIEGFTNQGEPVSIKDYITVE